MALNLRETRSFLQQADLTKLFVEQLGWDYYDTPLQLQVEGQSYDLQPVAHKRGFVVLRYQSPGGLPDYATRRKLERLVAKSHREHLVIYVDAAGREQVWQWVLREPGRPLASREHRYDALYHSGDALAQKLQHIAFTLDEEEDLTLIDVAGRLRAAFNVERATKKFYDGFRKERSAFEKFVEGIPDVEMGKWYVSVMLNRLMFVYFIQKKGFLDGDPNYLRNRLQKMQARHGDDQFYSFYRHFLLRLFHEGLGQPGEAHSPELDALIGKVPYLNGGIFAEHEVEQQYPGIQISDAAFENIFDFFDQYQWHLDDRPLRDDREINPDVLGYIFEKYINQKQMGAYYTKEDITGYIGRNTILPFLFDQARRDCAIAFEGKESVWDLLAADPDRYIYPAVRKGAELPLPEEIAAGLDDVAQRSLWNTRAPEEYALPTEIWRETVARRQRYEDVWLRLAGGEVRAINDLITDNLDIQQFAQDVVENSEGPELLRAFWKAIQRVSILDPTCGSGAFLFAALNILEPLYEACLGRMEAFVAELGPDDHPQKYRDFKETLDQVGQHPNGTYYILKSIVVNNLYGVDIMPEAVEIAKLRLFLKLASQVERVEDVEPLPDIDFNIRAGNTLVGFTTKDEVEQAMKVAGGGQGKLMFGEDQEALARIEDKAARVDRLFTLFRRLQTGNELQPDEAADFVATKNELRRRLGELEAELNRYLAAQYGVNPDKPAEYQKWLQSHQPFHWFVEFYGILKQGGFSVIIGNPPYVELRALKDYKTLGYSCESAGNLYALVMERCTTLYREKGRAGFIVPVSSVSTSRYKTLQELLAARHLHYSSFDDRPSRLFDGLEHIRLTIHLMGEVSSPGQLFSTRYNKWNAVEREVLFNTLQYAEVPVSPIADSLPKITSGLEASILSKLASRPLLSSFFDKGGRHSVLYSRKVGYFLQVLDFEPRVLDGDGNRRPPSEFKELRFNTKERAAIVLGCLNSSLFYWFVTVFSDCRHLNKREIVHFPVDLAELELRQEGKQLVELAKSLSNDLNNNSEDRKMKFSHDTLTIQCIFPKQSKAIIDRVDQLLAEYYGFTAEEADFIINYDVKYRMGDDLFDDEEGEED
jgi:hypothetical protein